MAFEYQGDKEFVPFPFPVVPPDVDPNSGNNVSVCFNADWLPYVLTCLKSLTFESSWKDADAAAIDLAVQRGHQLLGLFVDAFDGCNVPTPNSMCMSGTFADEPFGYENKTGLPDASVWDSGVGWLSAHLSGPNQDFLSIGRKLTAATFIRSIGFDAHTVPIPRGGHMTVTLRLDGVDVFTHTFTQTLGTVLTMDETPAVEADEVYIECQFDGSPAQQIVLDNWRMCYTGVFPLSEPPFSTFSHTFDFTASNGGWTSLDSHTTWVSGTGWRASFVGGVGSNVYMHFPIATRELVSFTIVYTMVNVGGANAVANLHFKLSGTDVRFFSHGAVNGAGQVDNYTLGLAVDDLVVDYNTGIAHTNALTTITAITVTGLGTDPF